MFLFECKVIYDRQSGEDMPGKVKESYLVEGATPADAEKRLMDEIGPYVFGDCEIPQIRKRNFFDIIRDENSDGDFFVAKVELITISDTGQEVRRAVNILVQEKNIFTALKRVSEHLESMDCEIISLSKSPIIEVYRVYKQEQEED